MNKFEEKKQNKVRPIKNTWYVWQINHILEPKRYRWFKDKVICHFKLNAPKKAVYRREKKSSKLKTQKQSQEEENYYKR